MAERNVPDVETLRAVAHPIRNKVLALLRYEGPATASQLTFACGMDMLRGVVMVTDSPAVP